MTRKLVEVIDLNVVARTDAGVEVPIVKNVNFSLKAGQVVALIGESGSGKTTIALSLLGYARRGCRIVGGHVRVGKVDVVNADDATLRDVRGRQVSYVAHSAAASFNPSRTIMDQVVEGVCLHGLMNRQAACKKAVELFSALALPSPDTIGARCPHQVSGGQLQRLMAAMALMADPEVVVFDEPTTALDVTTQIEVLCAFKRAIQDRNTSAVYVSHDLAVVAQMADEVVVLKSGEIQEAGAIDQIIAVPAHPYTRSLMAAAAPVARLTAADQAQAQAQEPLLQVKGLVAGYGKLDANGVPAIKILNDIDMTVRRGTTMGVIGESGSGKSTLAYVIAGLLGPAKCSIRFAGKPLGGTLQERDREYYRRIQLVFQNADTVLNPSREIGDILARPLKIFERCAPAEIPARVKRLLDMVKLPAHIARRRPAELSGGQKQRINLARALAAEPDLIICDEVTSALDTVVGAAILDLLVELRRELNMSYVFISHDISTVRTTCDDITVLFSGDKVDACRRDELTVQPRHPYTNLLVDSVPELRRGWLEEASGRIAASQARRKEQASHVVKP